MKNNQINNVPQAIIGKQILTHNKYYDIIPGTKSHTQLVEQTETPNNGKYTDYSLENLQNLNISSLKINTSTCSRSESIPILSNIESQLSNMELIEKPTISQPNNTINLIDPKIE